MVTLFGNIAQWQSVPLLRGGLDVRIILFPQFYLYGFIVTGNNPDSKSGYEGSSPSTRA